MDYAIPPDVLALPITQDDLRQTPKPIIVNVVATYDLWSVRGRARPRKELVH